MSEAPPGARELPLLVAEGGAAKSFYSFAKLSFLNAADGVLQTGGCDFDHQGAGSLFDCCT